MTRWDDRISQSSLKENFNAIQERLIKFESLVESDSDEDQIIKHLRFSIDHIANRLDSADSIVNSNKKHMILRHRR